MATVVNARDVQLQAYTPRVASVAIADNIVVDSGNVTGLDLVIAGTKMVFLEATSLIFSVPTIGSPTPASTTLTAKIQNLTNTPTLTVTSGTITPTPTLTGLTVTIPYSNLITETATMRLQVVQDSVTYFDDITIGKLREGADGFTGLLTNESSSITADSLGNPLSYFGCGGTFKVYQGLNDITSLCTFALAPSGNPSGLTYTLGGTTGVYSVTSGYPVGTDLTFLTFRATFGSSTIDKVFTIAKSKAGATGAPGSGLRGSRTFYVTLGGSLNTFDNNLATTTASVDGGPILNDTVVQTNQSMGFTQTKFLSTVTPIAWVTVNAVVDGNLLVSGTVGASKISVNSLTAIQSNLGTATIDASGYLRSTGATSFAVGSGFWMGYETGYKFRIGNPAGNQLTWDGSNLKVTGSIFGGGFNSYNWPAAGQTGFYIGPEGALFGNYNNGKYVQIYSDGNIVMPGFNVINGAATFSGAVNASSGNFRGEVNTGSYNGYAWPPAGQYGSHMSAGGILVGNGYNGTYFQVTNVGNIYCPNFSIINGAVTCTNATLTGQLQAGSISVGINGNMVFYDPNYGNMEVRSGVLNSYPFHTGDSGYFDANYYAYFPLMQTNDTELLFQAAPVELRRRCRVGSNRFNVVAVAAVDHYFTLWRRVNGGAWIPCVSIEEKQASTGTAALTFTWEEYLAAGWWIQFGITAGNADQTYGSYGLFLDQGRRELLYGYVSVSGVNF